MQLKRVSKDAGIEVLRVWLFDLPELAYQASIEAIESSKSLNDMQSLITAKKEGMMLALDKEKFPNQAMREAYINSKLAGDTIIQQKLVEIKELSMEVEKLKAARQYYDQIFKTVKDEVYYQHRIEELKDMKALSKAKVGEVKRFVEGSE